MIQQLMKNKEHAYEENSNKVFGVVTAIVTNTKDPKKMARVKIKYAWMGEAKTVESNWARVVCFTAGNAMGAHFLPEVDDEVLVVFEHGDINHPYIIGSVYSEKNKVVEKNEDGKNNIKMIKSRSGHTITLDDTDGKEKLIIEDKSEKRSITFDAKEKTLDIVNDEDAISINAKGDMTIKSEKKITIDGKSSIDLKSDGDINIKGKNVNLKSTASLEIKAGSSLTAKASAGVKLEAGSSMAIKGSASAKLEGATVTVKGSGTGTFDGGGMATIKGGMVKVN